MENECEALPGVAYPGVRDNRSTINTKTGYDDDDDDYNTATPIVCTHDSESINQSILFNSNTNGP